MAVTLKQSMKVGSYVLRHKWKGTKRYPLVLMLEPLYVCNLACAGCGKIQYPDEILRKRLSPQECWDAIEECGAPIVSIAGGEPLIHPEIVEIVEGFVAREKFVYLCTNAILLERSLSRFKPGPYLTLSIHLDGLEALHDKLVCREGVFRAAVSAIKAAKAAGFRVTTNTTVFEGEDPEELRKMFDFLTELGVDGMMVSPGYAYEKAPDQAHFLKRDRIKKLFQAVLKDRRKQPWQFNHSPQFLDFLEGKREYECTPWGNPSRNVFGWQRPCYLLQEGFARSWKELLETTDWSQYGRKSGNPKCQNCMVHCGYEPTAVMDTVSSPLEAFKAAKAVLVG